MAMARFAPGEKLPGTTVRESGAPAWLRFVWEVNGVAPATFGKPDTLTDTPARGYTTESYPTARVIHGPGDEGVRVVADTEESAAAFRTAADALSIHLT